MMKKVKKYLLSNDLINSQSQQNSDAPWQEDLGFIGCHPEGDTFCGG